jgi:hypothetical protein
LRRKDLNEEGEYWKIHEKKSEDGGKNGRDKGLKGKKRL